MLHGHKYRLRLNAELFEIFLMLRADPHRKCQDIQYLEDHNYEEKAKFQQQLPYIGFLRLLYNAFPVPDWS